MDLGVQRAAFEHAIAILIGKAPAELTIPPADIEHSSSAGAAGGSVGIAGTKAGHRQRGAAGGCGERADWDRNGGLLSKSELDGERRVGKFQLGKMVHLAQPLLVGWGRNWRKRFSTRGAAAAWWRSSRPAYDATVAAYRETVLTAMQQVEDNLAALRILAAEADKVQQTVRSGQPYSRHIDGAVPGRNGKLSHRSSPHRRRCSTRTWQR